MNMRRFLLILSVLSVLALYFLIVATGYADQLAQHFWYVVGFSGVLTLSLLFVLLRELWRLWQDGKHHVFGTKLTRRLVIMFTWVALLPGLFVFAVSVQFIAYSINSWFGNDTEEALDRSLQLARKTLDISAENTLNHAYQLIADKQEMASTTPEKLLKRWQKEISQLSLTQLILYRSDNGEKIGQITSKKLPLPLPNEMPSVQEYQQKTSYISIDNVLYTQGWLPLRLNQENYWLFFREPIAQQTAADVTLIENAKTRYAQLNFAKRGLQIFFLMTLVIATLLAMTLALLTAVFFARRFIAPLRSLAEATRAVAKGDFSLRSPIYRSDEMGMLSMRFNRMTSQLQQAKEAAVSFQQQQEAARAYLELILASITTGVMTLDETGSLKTFNAGATRILQLDLAELNGKAPKEWQEHGACANLAAKFVLTLLNDASGKALEVEYAGGDSARILLGKAIGLTGGHDTVLVFDDVTELVLAQKEAAWGEVARRLAHEIRNPLTPIQLSAERLEWRLRDKLNPEDTVTLKRSTDTIIKQVGALKEMVEAFRNYARSTTAKLQRCNFNAIIEEVLLLYEGSGCRLTTRQSAEVLWIKADATSIRQVLHNILKNAAEAAATAIDPEVTLVLERKDKQASLTVTNNGQAFPERLLPRIFEPYVTEKNGGTGLGLAVVKKIIEEHHGMITLGNMLEEGAWVTILIPIMET